MGVRLRANWTFTAMTWAVTVAIVIIAWSQVRQARTLELIAATCMVETTPSEADRRAHGSRQ